MLPPGRILDEGQTEHFAFGKLDYQASPAHRGSLRIATFFNDSPLAGVSGFEVPDRAFDIFARSGSGAVQVASLVGRSGVNEVRAQDARRVMSRRDSRTTAPPPAIDIAGVAFFGGPYAAVQSGDSDFTEAIWQVIDNFSWQTGRHTYKTGIDVQRIADGRVNTRRRRYRFGSIDSYLAAASGIDPRVYQSYLEDVGNPTIAHRTTFVSVFGQDEWRSRLESSFSTGCATTGLVRRRPTAAVRRLPLTGITWHPVWRSLVDRFSLAHSCSGVCRAGFRSTPARSVRGRAVARVKTERVQTVVVRPRNAGAPPFPATLEAVDQRQSVVEIAEDFETQSNWLTHVQIERALGSATAFAVSLCPYSRASLPVLVDVEPHRPGPTWLTAVRFTAMTDFAVDARRSPLQSHRFVRPSARSRYDALIVTLPDTVA